MTSGATELAFLPLKPGIKLEDGSSEAGTTWNGILSTLRSREGYQGCRWGYEIENLTMVQLVVDWDAVSSHQAFIDAPEYGPFVQNLLRLLTTTPKLYHTHLSPHPPSAAMSKARSPVTEVVTFYFQPGMSDADAESFNEVWATFAAALDKARGHTATASGWVVEELEHSGLEGKGRAYVAAIGWESVDAHMQYRETDAFKETIKGLRDRVGVIQMNHVSFNVV